MLTRNVVRSLAVIVFAAATIIAQAQSSTEVVLHDFASPPKGAFPYAGVIRDQAGNFYGTTQQGGTWNQGVVFKITPNGKATVLHAFKGSPDGRYPLSGVILDSAGNLYGTTSEGGPLLCTSFCGVVYKLDPAGNETILHTFTGGIDGNDPTAGVILDDAGNLYGTTRFGGAADTGVSV